MQTKNFQKKIWDFYKTNKREFPWRSTTDPYKILVSEVMLQQTQSNRVLPKYRLFLKKFPDLKALAKSSNEDVLRAWSGLGYNRRALYLKRSAELILKEFQGMFPLDTKNLQTFPGVGPNTAGAIYVFVLNKPHVFIETNIRRVFIYEFFRNKNRVSDKDILGLIDSTLNRNDPRKWYYALMDYGAYLGKAGTNPNRKSIHYMKQSKFEGSLRQTRGKILKILLTQKKISASDLKKQLKNTKNLNKAFEQLRKEGFLETRLNNMIQLIL